MAGGIASAFHRTITQNASLWSNSKCNTKSNSNTKTKTASEGKICLSARAGSCSQNQLDRADFLIDGLTYAAPSGAVVEALRATWWLPLTRLESEFSSLPSPYSSARFARLGNGLGITYAAPSGAGVAAVRATS